MPDARVLSRFFGSCGSLNGLVVAVPAGQLVNGLYQRVQLVFACSLGLSEALKAGFRALRKADLCLGNPPNEVGDSGDRRLQLGCARSASLESGVDSGDCLLVPLHGFFMLLKLCLMLGLHVQNELHGFFDVHGVSISRRRALFP